MAETRQYPYAPKVVKDYLDPNLPGVWVTTEVPTNWQAESSSLVTIEMVPATSEENLVLSTRRLIIQCWNSDELDAGNLAERVRQLMFDVRYNRVRWMRSTVIVGEPGRFDDPDTAMPRFQLTVDVLLRALTK
jgi:hypothetical protein